MKPIVTILFLALILPVQLSSAQEVEKARFHHVHLNVTDPQASIDFYKRIFGGVPVKFRNKQDAIFTERSFLLFNKVPTPPNGKQESGIWHIGWGGIDIPALEKWYKSQNVEVHTPIYPLRNSWVTYWNDPDDVMIEVNTMNHHRFAHVHLFAQNPNETAQWYAKHLGLNARTNDENNPRPVGENAEFKTWKEFHEADNRAWSSGFRCDNISFVVYNIPDYTPAPPWWPFDPLKELAPQKGRAIDHFAFSYRDIGPVYERMKKAGVTITGAITWKEDLDMRSFFILGPNDVTIEIVEAKPIPEGLWE